MRKKDLAFLLIGIITLLGGAALLAYTFLKPTEQVADLEFPTIEEADPDEGKTFSNLTGLEIDASLQNAPTFCIQTPNGTDGARPQAGLDQAGVIFEAIAEAGITRFAAIYQNPTSSVIGPIRSLRIYYLDWDVPFDCTIVHAGGAPSALAAVQSYRHQSENYTYMYRGTVYSRLWNNLFTTATDLAQVAVDQGQSSSNVQGFTHMTPTTSTKSRVDSQIEEKLDITTATTKNTSTLTPSVSSITLRFGGVSSYNPTYSYDAETNTYKRGYTSGYDHEIYSCEANLPVNQNPEDICTLTQLSPSVVIAMIVQEQKDDDNYHEAITTIGTGDVYIFQNGTVIEGTWSKSSRESQIKFYDENNQEIALAPGQAIVSAIPTYGSVEY